jgi:PilZ domain
VVILLRYIPAGTGVSVYQARTGDCARASLTSLKVHHPMKHNTLPTVGASVLVILPRPCGEAASPVLYRVVEVRDRQLTLRAGTVTTGRTPGPGVQCIIGPAGGARAARCDAVVVSSTTSALIVEVERDREPPRSHRPYKVCLEAPDGGLDHVVGVLEDISAGGMRVHTPVPLPLGLRVFASILFADTQPVLAIAEVCGVCRGDGPDDHVARLQFTLMAPSHRARLNVLLAWPLDEPDTQSAGDGQSSRR